jgi:hypothetical protein
MAWFLFIDDSGQDKKESPYEVLAGVAIHDSVLWKLVLEVHDAEVLNFGRRYSDGPRELKGRKILKKKVFDHAALSCEVKPEEITTLAKAALDDGAHAYVRHLKALALAKIKYVSDVFLLCEKYGCKLFASVVEQDAHPTGGDGLRKDYAYLFERFFYFLEDQKPPERGVMVFDELEKAKSHILLDQTLRYFRDSAVGKLRASLVIPEPLFVHSELTTGVQIADLLAYCISWNFRTPKMTKPSRRELDRYSGVIARLRYRAVRNREGNPNFEIWSIAHISDLRTRMEIGFVK